jgi:hypothetical protein
LLNSASSRASDANLMMRDRSVSTSAAPAKKIAPLTSVTNARRSIIVREFEKVPAAKNVRNGISQAPIASQSKLPLQTYDNKHVFQ